MGSSSLWSLVLVCSMTLASAEVWAKRVGGGQSMGRQSGNVSQPAATPQVQPAASRATSTTPAANAPRRSWGAMLGGLAAGLGLAWLASSLGLGEDFAQFLMGALLALVLVAVLARLLRRRQPAPGAQGLAYQGGAAGAASVQAHTPRGYSPQNVGNDASARPWESAAATVDNGACGVLSSASPEVAGPNWGVPAGFDTEGFLRASKTNFIHLQDAWDRSDIPSLRAMMTDAMLEQIKSQLAEREESVRGENRTDVVMLEAHLLGIEELEDAYMASVEFSGLIREDASAGPNPFREVWNITRPKAGPAGWLVAGVQALQ
jgi:predicted lipid-binding transport protein (Tim44 family)